LYAVYTTILQDPQQRGHRHLIDDSALVNNELIYETEVFSEPVISVVFDDGWESIYSSGLPILEKYGIDTTQFLLSGTFAEPQYMSKEQVDHLVERGHDIGSHGDGHLDLPKLSPPILDQELFTSRVNLESSFNTPVEDFASPYGRYNAVTIANIKKYYRSHRTTQTGMNTEENFNAYQLESPSITVNTTLDEIKEMIDEARAKNAWLILTYHQVDYSNDEYSVTPETFEDHMKLILESSVDIATYVETLDMIKDQYE